MNKGPQSKTRALLNVDPSVVDWKLLTASKRRCLRAYGVAAPLFKSWQKQPSFVDCFQKTDTCWIWTKRKDKDGYGVYRTKTQRRAHRVAYEIAYGPIPNGLVVMHSCDNPSCVNLGHLHLGTPRENNDDKMRKRRHAYGSRIGVSKLSEAEVKEIRDLFGTISTMEIGRRYGISGAHALRVARGDCWKHVADKCRIGST